MVKIGLQLYSIREQLEQDFFGSLEKVKQAGYDCVEFAGYYGHEAKALRSALLDMGLEPYATHTRFDEDLAATVAYSAALGLKYAILPYSPADSLEACMKANALLKQAAKLFGAEGITVGYHNHPNELVKFDGRYALDIIMDGVAGIYEVDTAWVQAAGVDVVPYMKSLGDRVGPIHAKDINADWATRKLEDVDVCIGEGVLDFPGIIGHLKATGALSRGLIVEQEAFQVPIFEALAKNVRELRALTA